MYFEQVRGGVGLSEGKDAKQLHHIQEEIWQVKQRETVGITLYESKDFQCYIYG